LERYLEITGNVLSALELHKRSLQVRVLHILVILRVKICFTNQAVGIQIRIREDPGLIWPGRIRIQNNFEFETGSDSFFKKLYNSCNIGIQ
jgi:hypothetical protein